VVRIVALHGFLGLPSDWDFLREGGFDVIAPELDAFHGGQALLPVLGRGGHDDVLLGYSMGGRLALQALLVGAKYDKAVLISTRVSPAAESREAWAQRFERDEWETLLRDWNAQPLFGGHSMPRAEKDFDRAELARQLREHLPAALPRLHELTIPTLWIAGARDAKYVAEAELAASRAPRATVEIVDGAAHRVPWERPDAVVASLRRFLGVR
jgi:2-succinyl-6-hydroxy-2,4-cyclohexadiene-1-carboxylate synthase